MGPRSLPPDGWVTGKMLAVAVGWLLLTRVVPEFAWRAVPASLLAKLTLPTYSMICQVFTTGLGLAVTWWWVAEPCPALALERCRWRGLVIALLVAPAVFVITSRVALTLAEPYLMAELATKGGESASRRNAGEFGRAVTEAPLVVTVLWGVALAALSEELLFRGLLVSALARLGALLLLVAREHPDAAETRNGRTLPIGINGVVRQRAERVSAIAAVVIAAAIFAAMHADMQGSVGVVRVGATACLGLASGIARLLTGSVLPAIAMHLAYNTVSVGLGRAWFGMSTDSLLPAVPDRLLMIAAIGMLSGGLICMIGRDRPRAS